MKKYSPMKRLKIKRIEADLTQSELAKKVGITKNALSSYETGFRFPRKCILDKLAEALDCKIEELI